MPLNLGDPHPCRRHYSLLPANAYRGHLLPGQGAPLSAPACVGSWIYGAPSTAPFQEHLRTPFPPFQAAGPPNFTLFFPARVFNSPYLRPFRLDVGFTEPRKNPSRAFCSMALLCLPTSRLGPFLPPHIPWKQSYPKETISGGLQHGPPNNTIRRSPRPCTPLIYSGNPPPQLGWSPP